MFKPKPFKFAWVFAGNKRTGCYSISCSREVMQHNSARRVSPHSCKRMRLYVRPNILFFECINIYIVRLYHKGWNIAVRKKCNVWRKIHWHGTLYYNCPGSLLVWQGETCLLFNTFNTTVWEVQILCEALQCENTNIGAWLASPTRSISAALYTFVILKQYVAFCF